MANLLTFRQGQRGSNIELAVGDASLTTSVGLLGLLLVCVAPLIEFDIERSAQVCCPFARCILQSALTQFVAGAGERRNQITPGFDPRFLSAAQRGSLGSHWHTHCNHRFFYGQCQDTVSLCRNSAVFFHVRCDCSFNLLQFLLWLRCRLLPLGLAAGTQVKFALVRVSFHRRLLARCFGACGSRLPAVEHVLLLNTTLRRCVLGGKQVQILAGIYLRLRCNFWSANIQLLAKGEVLRRQFACFPHVQHLLAHSWVWVLSCQILELVIGHGGEVRQTLGSSYFFRLRQ